MQTGRPSVDALRGTPMFEWLEDEPEFAAAFNEGMTGASDTEIEPVLAVYDFSRFSTVVDVGGSFFESVPSGGDAQVLKHIVHDWDESKALEILRNVRSAMAANSKLLVIETVIPDDDREQLSKLLDLEMLVAGTGRERTAAEYIQLLHRAGFRNTRVIPTVGPTPVVESEAA